VTTRKKATRKTTRKKAPQDLQARVKKSANKIWLAGLGAFALAEEEGGKLFKSLVSKGKGFEEKGRDQLEKARGTFESIAGVARDKATEVAGEVKGRAGSAWSRVADDVDDAVSSALHKVGVPTREEINRLTRRIEHLTALVEDKVGGRKAAPRKKAAARKAPRKKAARKGAPRRKATRKSAAAAS